jgi:hypothetical protein
MAKVVKAKWSIGSDKPEDLPDFLSNDEILEKNGDKYPRGRFRLWVKEITVKVNNSGDDMMVIRCEINETDKVKKSYNGWFLITNQNITDKGKPYLLKFLKGLGVTWDDFMDNTRQTPATSIEPTKILSIGSVKFTGNAKVYADALLVKDTYNDQERSQIGRWIPKSKDSDEEEIDEEEETDDEELEEEDDSEEDEDEVEMSDEEAELREELEALTKVKLKARAKANGAKLAEYKDLDEEGLIDLIVEQEIEEEEDDEEDEDEDEDEADDDGAAEEELREELSGLTIAQLKARAKANKRKLAEYKTAKTPELIEMIVEDELGAEDDDEPPF